MFCPCSARKRLIGRSPSWAWRPRERQFWDNQDESLKQRHPLRRRSTFTLAWEGGGEVSAIPSGPDKIRAFHPSRYVQDESAFMPDGEECLNAVLPNRGTHHLHFDSQGWLVRGPMRRDLASVVGG